MTLLTLLASCCDLNHPSYYPLIGYLPGFSWDSIYFHPNSWYSALFWIQYEYNVDNTLMFRLLLSRAYLKSRTFPCLMI